MRSLLPERWRAGRHKSERTVMIDGRPVLMGVVFTTRDGEWDVRHIRDCRKNPSPRAPVIGLTLVLGGTCRMRDGYGGVHPGATGTCFQLDDQGNGRMGLADWSADFQEVSCYLHGHLGPRLRAMGLIDPHWRVTDRVRDGAALTEAYLRLHRDLIDPALDAHHLVRRLIGFLDHVHRQRPAADDPQAMGTMAEACRLLRSQLEPGYRVTDLARDLDINVHTLRRRFRQEIGISPGDYQLQHRMRAARTLLARHSVGEVADRLGYQDGAQFTRQFRQVFGQTPRKARQQEQERRS